VGRRIELPYVHAQQCHVRTFREQRDRVRRRARRLHPRRNRLRKNGPFLEFSLCLSRACLGKMIVFKYKWHRKKTVFTHRALYRYLAAAAAKRRRRTIDCCCGRGRGGGVCDQLNDCSSGQQQRSAAAVSSSGQQRSAAISSGQQQQRSAAISTSSGQHRRARIE
jgi:hypothetical protein